MTHINIKISKAVATAEKDGIITAGMVGVPVSFMFDSWWDGLIVTAVFKGSGAPISVPLLGATETVVPWEVLKRPSTLLRIGAEGRLPDGTLVIPTTWATVGIVMSGANATDDLAKPPTPTAFDRIMSQIGNMNDLTTEAKDTLVAAINEAARTGGGAGSMDLRVADGYVQYSTDGGMTWTNLIAMAELKGDPGEPGNDGHSPVVTATKSGKTTTISVDGAAIATVEDGADGKDGVTPHIGDNGNWYLGAEDTGKPSRGETGAPGAAGQQGEKGEKGDKGDTGPAGPKGDTGEIGPQGPKGPQGEQGPQGPAGAYGKSAYQYAVDGGYTGTETEFAAKLAEELPDKLPNPNALTFTGAISGSYDGSSPLEINIPIGGGSGGSGKAKTQKLIDITFSEPTASLSVTLEHNFHKLFLVWSCGSNGVSRLVDADGNDVIGNIRILLDTTSYSWSERIIGQLFSDKAAWLTSAHLIEYTADLSTLLSSIEIPIKTGPGGNVLNQFGGTTAMIGTIGGNALAPTVGRTVNIVTSGGFFAATTRIVLVGEYYE